MGLRMLQGRYLSVLETKTAEAFEGEVIGFARSIGFDLANAMTVVDHSLTHSEFFTVNNSPLEYAESYHDPRLGKVDPVMQHCKNASIPIVWNQATYVAQGYGEKWEHQAQFGYKEGIGLAFHFPEGRHFAIGVNGNQRLPSSEKKLSRMVADLQLFAVHAQEAAFSIFAPASKNSATKLTPRELECIRWTMEGKTAADVAEKLNISERTAVFHLHNSMRKLNCTSKYQAVLKALRLGLLI